MRIPRRLVIVVLILLFAEGTGYSTTLVLQKEVSVVRALAGHVLVRGTDEPLSGVTVELRSPDWQTVLASTKTDERGHFLLDQPKPGRPFYIRLSAPGMESTNFESKSRSRQSRN